ncbi:MAG: type I secretion system permease/ATPase [Devosia sp.]
MKSVSKLHPQLTAVRKVLAGRLVAIGVFSGIVNLLMLTGPLFMLQVYDRVLTSQSVDTLLALAGLAVGLYLFMAIIDAVRSRVLVAMGHRFEQQLAGAAFAHTVAAPLSKVPHDRRSGGSDAINDVAQVRGFLTGQGATALFDLPWIPVYFGIVFSLHLWLGLVGILGGVVLVTIAIITDVAVRKATRAQAEHATRRGRIAEAGRRNADLIRAMGMNDNLSNTWQSLNDNYLGASARAANTVGLSASLTKVFRLALQSAVLAVGAYLAIQHAISPGAMIAASIIMARGLQPIETLVGSWRAMVAAERAWRGLKAKLSGPAEPQCIDLPAPRASLTVDGLAVVPPGATSPSLRGVSFTLNAGESLAVIGATGGGKSTLARALVGAWAPAMGSVRLDGVALEHYRPQTLGAEVGFLSQDVELFEGTIAQNIARFDPQARDEAVVAAAKAARVHDLVSTFPDGYNTDVGERGTALSGGQRQRLALARALYNDPFLVVLDEPNSNLDMAGEMALNEAIQSARARGAIVVVVAHRAGSLAVADKVLVVENGQAVDFGPRDEVLKRCAERDGANVKRPQPAPPAKAPIQVIRGSVDPLEPAPAHQAAA